MNLQATHFVLIQVVFSISVSTVAQATLGEDESSAAADAVTLKTAVKTPVKAPGSALRINVRHHESSNGHLSVKQFADSTGKIYAVSWTGFNHPDLEVLLGSYYAEYSAASAQQEHSIAHRRSTLRTAHLVVHLSGVPHHMSGMVYIPSLLPPDVKEEDLK